ncbi:hypothetical protein EJ08DRAFT_658886 [Tothia fuscella]|uniref:Uncharacterized protein n=1 Tax=Tothia fuscella TaxID=1048955 RepID=A0A9P4NWL2_9PEZI|nr:hypothetical protein EJ08DRAFT_658886 [Tothia fuscella]
MSIMADQRLESRTGVAENTDRTLPQPASSPICRCMSDAYFLVHHIPASFISVQNILNLSLLFNEIHKHFLPVLIDAQIKVFCVPDLTYPMLGGQGKILAVHNFFRRVDPKVFKFLAKVEVVTLSSFKLKGDDKHGYMELKWFYDTFPLCEFVTSNVSVPRRQVDELWGVAR